MKHNRLRIRPFWIKAVLILFILAAGFGTGRQIAIRIRSKKPVVTKSVGQLILELQEKDTSIHQAYVQWWFTRPGWFQRTLGLFAPTSRAAVHHQAARGLGNLGAEAKEAVPVLIQALNDSDAQVQIASLQALAAIGRPAREALPAILSKLNQLLKVPGPAGAGSSAASIAMNLGGGIIAALGSVAPDEPIVLENLNRVLGSKSISGTPATIAFEAARMLGTLATETNSAVDILAEMLRTTEGPLKWELISVLGIVSAKRIEAVQAVISALDSPDPIARGNALLALGGRGAEAGTATSRLIELYRQEQAARIHETSTEATSSPVAFWPQNFDHAGPEKILQTFGRIGPTAKQAIPLCAEIYTNPTNRYRLAAALSRWKIDQATMEVLPLFLDGTKSEDLTTRQSVAAQAAKMGSDALPIMKLLLQENDFQIRRTIIA